MRRRNSKINASQYLYPDFDTAYKWDQEEVREPIWFDYHQKQFLTFDEVLSIAGESFGLYRPKAKHEANYDLDEFIDKYLYGKNIFPYWYGEVIELIADEFNESSYNNVVEDMDNPIDSIKDFVYSTYAGVTSKVKNTLSSENDWWFNEILEYADINYTDGNDWSGETMLDWGRQLYNQYGPNAGTMDMTEYDAESYLAYRSSIRNSIGASSAITAASKPKLCFLLVDRSGYVSRKPTIWIGTLDYLIRAFSYTLEVGQSWQHEKGNHKISRNPRNIESLAKNLQWAKDNAARNGYSGTFYDALSVEDLDRYDDENANWSGEINGQHIFSKPTPEQLGL